MKLVLTASAMVAVVMAVAMQPQHPIPSDGHAIGSVKGVNDPDKAVRTLAAFTALKTLSDRLAPNHVPDVEPFLAAHDFLRKSFPKVFSTLAVETVSDLSLLLKWEGSDGALKPMLLMAHIDVVPADDSNTSLWTHPPFGGVIAKDGFVYGRGSMDIKSMLTAELEAAEQLLTDGFKPDRTIYLAFGHDEEVGGSFGAEKIASLLESRGVQLEFVLDEGGVVLADGVKPFVSDPVAIVGTAEKGFSLTEVHFRSPGGHSAMPPVKANTIASMMGRLFATIDRQPTPLTVVKPMPDFFAALATGARYRGLAWLLRHADHPLISKALALGMSRKPDTAALIRTTLSATRMAAGVADNVLPQTGVVTFNARHLPGQGPDFVSEYLMARLGADRQHASVELLDSGRRAEASVVSPPDGPTFQRIARATRATMGMNAMVVAPYLVVGGTDSKHYSALTDNIYRFQPVAYSISKGDLKRIHGTDERISRDAYLKSISFFMLFISSSDSPATGQQ